MNSKSGRSKPSADGSSHEHPMDSCTHLISTSLKDLSAEYQNLSYRQADAADSNKKDLDGTVQGEKKSDLK
ncbi:hypothetical protein [Desulfospira joergensenii]|uniref:hypothetical protein n=1 Tax=Desulfospira joergensenii TaxID=53329 RepID=UPI00129474A4|nr:hypothetical protein [Desulfospira joergensenii]